jgi:hypothetical protein
MDERPQLRAAPQHFELVVKVRFGPKLTIVLLGYHLLKSVC